MEILHELRDSIVGGPTLVITRKHNKDETFLRNCDPSVVDKSMCKSVVGVDNLNCMNKELPVGQHFIRSEPDYRLTERWTEKQSRVAYEWLLYKEFM